MATQVSAYDSYMDATMKEVGMDGYGTADYGYGDEYGIDEPDVSQEDCWDVIRAFFAEKGLVRQQLDSFNEFVHNTMQELVDEVRTLTLEQSSQHTGREDDKAVSIASLVRRCSEPVSQPLLLILPTRTASV